MNLVKWDEISNQIDVAKDIKELQAAALQLEALGKYLKKQHQGSLKTQNKIARYKNQIDRKIGDWSKSLEKQQGQRSDLTSSHQREEVNKKDVLKKAGYSKSEANRKEQISNIPKNEMEKLYNKIESQNKEITEERILKLSKELERENIREERAEQGKSIILPGHIKLYNEDFRKVDIKYNSIDLIITDPPYPKEYLDLWDGLQDFALKHLKKDGYLIAYSGQMFLPIVLNKLIKNGALNYVWLFCLYHKWSSQYIKIRNIFCEWKPAILLKKGKVYRLENSICDVSADKRNKELHDWQQGQETPEYFINHFTDPGEVVCDPMAGAGTFLRVAKNLNRKIVGMEIDEKNYNIIKSEL